MKRFKYNILYETALTLFCILSVFNSVAQSNHTLRGRIVNQDGEVIDGAIVAQVDSVNMAICLTISDSLGYYLLDSLPKSFNLCVTHALHETYNTNVEFSTSSQTENIVLSALKTITIEEVVVSASYIKHSGASYTTTLKNNPMAENTSTLSFMNTLPGVSGISVYNQPPSIVYLNGIELKLPPNQILQYLSSLQASDVHSIKVEPYRGAKYRADHQGGVIHIKLANSTQQNFSASITPNVGVNHYDAAPDIRVPMTFNFTSPKFSSYTYISPTYLGNEHSESSYSIDTDNYLESSNREMTVVSINQSLVYQFNKKHSLGAMFTSMIKPNETSTTLSLDPTTNMQLSELTNKIELYRYGGAVNYDFTMDERGSNISFNADYLYNEDIYNSSYIQQGGETKLTNTTTKKHTYALGLMGDYIFKDEISELSYGVGYLDLTGNQSYDYDLGSADEYDYQERNYNVYAEFYTSLFDESVDVFAGLRYEYASLNWVYSDVDYQQNNRSESYGDLIPSFSLTVYPGSSNLTLDYTRSRDLPTMSSYDPVVYQEGENVFYTGANTLAPEYEDVISLLWNKNNKYSASLSYTIDNDVYDYIYTLDGDNIVETYDNLGSLRKVELYTEAKPWLIKEALRMNVSFTLDYTKYTHESYGNIDNYGGAASISFTSYLPKKWYILLSGNYRSSDLSGFTKVSEYWSLNAKIIKIVNDRFRFSIFANNFLRNKTLSIVSLQGDVDYCILLNNYLQQTGVNMTYKFGSSSNQSKRARSNYDTQLRGGSNY